MLRSLFLPPTVRLAALALVGMLAVGGCGDAEPTPAGSTPATHVGLGGPSVAPLLPSIAVRDVDQATFRTPSKNITCSLNRGSIRCDITRKTWSPPPKPGDCQLDWGNGLYIDAGATGFTCAGDALAGSADRTLEYGTALRAGDLRCDSESSALTCTDGKSGHGFTLAIAEYNFF
ncbi:DUF6636 domain-containing protein [Micromonosporaceae bacterium Da 78-11]